MTVAYAQPQDVYDLGFSAVAFASRPRPVGTGGVITAGVDVDLTTATIRLRAHGLADDDVVVFEATSGGKLPTGISAFTGYTPIKASADLFRLSGVSSFASAGSGWSIAVDPERRLRRHILDACAQIDECLTAEEPPLDAPYPVVVVGLAARMAARSAVPTLAFENAADRVAFDRVEAMRERDEAMLADWKAGKPIQPRPVDQSAVPDNAPRASYGRPSQGWGSGYL